MNIFSIVQVVVALLLSGCILLQSEGSGLSNVFGGEQFYGTRRGVEKVVFSATVALATIFLVLSLVVYIS